MGTFFGWAEVTLIFFLPWGEKQAICQQLNVAHGVFLRENHVIESLTTIYIYNH